MEHVTNVPRSHDLSPTASDTADDVCNRILVQCVIKRLPGGARFCVRCLLTLCNCRSCCGWAPPLLRPGRSCEHLFYDKMRIKYGGTYLWKTLKKKMIKIDRGCICCGCNSSVGIVTVRAGDPRNRGSIPGRVKRY
jgi:hypothetical protein